MRFLADENVSRLVIERLRADGLEVASISETRSGMPDRNVLETADIEGRILITEDRDFGELVVRQRMAVSGVILLELDKLSNQAEAERVSHIVNADRRLRGAALSARPARCGRGHQIPYGTAAYRLR